MRPADSALSVDVGFRVDQARRIAWSGGAASAVRAAVRSRYQARRQVTADLGPGFRLRTWVLAIGRAGAQGPLRAPARCPRLYLLDLLARGVPCVPDGSIALPVWNWSVRR